MNNKTEGRRTVKVGACQVPKIWQKESKAIACINICYDTNFPEAAMALANQGANLIVCCSNTMMRRQKSEKLINLHNQVRSQRCKETGLWMISSDIRGEKEGRIAYGPTAVINPDGNVVAQMPLLGTGIVWADIPV